MLPSAVFLSSEIGHKTSVGKLRHSFSPQHSPIHSGSSVRHSLARQDTFQSIQRVLSSLDLLLVISGKTSKPRKPLDQIYLPHSGPIYLFNWNYILLTHSEPKYQLGLVIKRTKLLYAKQWYLLFISLLIMMSGTVWFLCM